MRALDRRRSQVFAHLELAGLDDIYVRQSSPWRSDHALLNSYRQRGLRVDGLQLEISRLEFQGRAPRAPGKSTVVVRVVDRLVAGAVVDRGGRRTRLPPGTATARLITLTDEEGGWRISDVVAA